MQLILGTLLMSGSLKCMVIKTVNIKIICWTLLGDNCAPCFKVCVFNEERTPGSYRLLWLPCPDCQQRSWLLGQQLIHSSSGVLCSPAWTTVFHSFLFKPCAASKMELPQPATLASLWTFAHAIPPKYFFTLPQPTGGPLKSYPLFVELSQCFLLSHACLSLSIWR